MKKKWKWCHRDIDRSKETNFNAVRARASNNFLAKTAWKLVHLFDWNLVHWQTDTQKNWNRGLRNVLIWTISNISDRVWPVKWVRLEKGRNYHKFTNWTDWQTQSSLIWCISKGNNLRSPGTMFCIILKICAFIPVKKDYRLVYDWSLTFDLDVRSTIKDVEVPAFSKLFLSNELFRIIDEINIDHLPLLEDTQSDMLLVLVYFHWNLKSNLLQKHSINRSELEFFGRLLCFRNSSSIW